MGGGASVLHYRRRTMTGLVWVDQIQVQEDDIAHSDTIFPFINLNAELIDCWKNVSQVCPLSGDILSRIRLKTKTFSK